ncbi:hypothetical protein BsWGS_09655 [Bradybaena similaris]
MMESERPETVTAGGHISSDVSNNHLTYESGSLGRSSQASLSAGAETVASENEHQHTAGLDNVEVRDEKEIVDNAAVAEVDKLHEEAVKSTTSLGSKASHNLPEKDGEKDEASQIVNTDVSNTRAKKKKNKRSKKTREKQTAVDKGKVIYVTECTQTDWKWKDKAEKSGKGTVLSSSVVHSPFDEKATSAGSRSASLKSVQVKSDSRQSIGQAEEEMESKREIVTVTDLTPFFLVPDDEFGIPIVELSSDSDTSIEESFERSKHYRHHLPSIGPPQILRYIRESEILEKTGEKANENWDYAKREASSETLTFEENDSSQGMFSGPCEFCGTDIKPFPSLDEQLSQPPESLYCCEEYREFVEFATTTAVRMEEELVKDKQQISIKVHAHHGSAHDRHVAKEKAVQRMHERELMRRQQEANGLQAAIHQNSQILIEGLGSGDVISNEEYSILGDHGVEAELGSFVQNRNTIARNEGGTVTNEAASLANGKAKPERGGNREKDKRKGFSGFVKDKSHEQNAKEADSHYRGLIGRGAQREVGPGDLRGRGAQSEVVPGDLRSRGAQRGMVPAGLRGRGAQRGMISGGPQTHHFSLGTPAGARSWSSSFGPLNIEVARQMKTINYQLSSQRCLEQGWTLRAPSPMVTDDAESEMFVLEPLHPAMIAAGKLQGRPLVEKFYPNGSKFLTIFPDGTGNILYPSGRLAILISSIALGQNTYIVQDDSDEPALLGVFGPTGYGCCCFANSKVRLTYDPLEGLELDYTGARKRVWNWKDQDTHVHAPPFQPIVFGMNNYLGVRFMAQENIALTFTGSKRSCRFNVGVKLKMVTPDNLQPKVIQEDELLISEHKIRVETIMNKVSNLLKFPKSPKIDCILPPLSVSVRRQRMERLKKASVSGDKSRQPFKQTKLPLLDSATVSVN